MTERKLPAWSSAPLVIGGFVALLCFRSDSLVAGQVRNIPARHREDWTRRLQLTVWIVRGGSSCARRRTAALVLLSPLDEDHVSLGRFLISTGFRVHRAHTRQEAMSALCKDRVAVVISERNLPEGDWRDVLRELEPLANPPFLIVTTKHADD